MSASPAWETEQAVRFMQRRSLAANFPGLAPYLSRGLHVLAVGCGPGTITLGVAEVVNPGSVVGVDLAAKMIEEATAEAERSQAPNVRYQVGDAYHLDFPDGAFDVTYSHALIVHLKEPVRALIEQKRVTRKGGWVIAAVGDYGTRISHPAMPAFDVVWNALSRLKEPSNPGAFVNLFAGRESLSMFAAAGLQDIRLTAADLDLTNAGSDRFERWYGLCKDWFLGPRSQHLSDMGAVDEHTVQAARAEIEGWHNHPHAFFMTASVCAAGRVP